MSIREHVKNMYIETYNVFSKPSKNLYFFYGHYAYLEEESAEFEVLIEKLSHYVDFINFEDALEIVKTQTFEKIDKPTVCFSFDDGFNECYTHIYPVLKKYGVNACFFVNPNFVDGDANYVQKFQTNRVHIKKESMSREMIREMSNNGFLFGSHTLNHANLAKLNHQELINELDESKIWLENLLKKECKYFAWPYGTMKQISTEALDEACKRYEYVFSAIRNNNYFCCDNPQIINRDHFESFWLESHIRFFLSQSKRI